MALYSYFLSRVKRNLHVVLAMSPIGDAFRTRLRQFPSLINCCTIGKQWNVVSLNAITRGAPKHAETAGNVTDLRSDRRTDG